MDNIVKKTIKNFKNIVSEVLFSADKETIKRNRKVAFKHIFYTLIQMVNNNKSYLETMTNFKIDNIIDVSYQAINKKIINNNYSKYFGEINKRIVEEFFYKNNNSRKSLA